jgi:hypothetical protein
VIAGDRSWLGVMVVGHVGKAVEENCLQTFFYHKVATLTTRFLGFEDLTTLVVCIITLTAKENMVGFLSL